MPKFTAAQISQCTFLIFSFWTLIFIYSPHVDMVFITVRLTIMSPSPPPSLPPCRFGAQRVVQQLRACGILETVRISAAGFPSRWLCEDFFQRYSCLVSSGLVCRSDQRGTCRRILEATVQVCGRGGCCVM